MSQQVIPIQSARAHGATGNRFRRAHGSSTTDPTARWRSYFHLHRDLLLVAGFALGLRILFLALTSDTYDYDEFVVLLLSRDFAHGAIPYQDFMFFHPPGVLVVFRALEPVTALWWPLARILVSCLDVATALLVWKIGTVLWGRRTGVAAGILYGLSPLALVSAVRVGQDPLITFLGTLGLFLLLSRSSWRSAAAAGICLGIAVWIKYPAIYFLPIYVLAARQRASLAVPVSLCVFGILMLPFHAQIGDLYAQTVTFQRDRWSMSLDTRVETTLLFWLIASPLALPGIVMQRRPLWLSIGFLLGGLFDVTSQVYYHYFVVVVPFAALASAPVAIRLIDAVSSAWIRRRTRLRVQLPSYVTSAVGRKARWRPVLFASAAMAMTIAWAELIQWGGSSPLYVTAAHLSALTPTVDLLDKDTSPTQPILGDRFEYAYLADRPAKLHYFWNVGTLVDAGFLEPRLPHKGAVVESYGASSGYPAGLTNYLDSRYDRIDTGPTSVWLLGRPKK